jgi:hypothetical protein
MLHDGEAACCRASDAEMVGRRSGPGVNVMDSVTHAPGNVRAEDEFEKFVMSSCSSIARRARTATTTGRPSILSAILIRILLLLDIQRFAEHKGIKNNQQGSLHTL